MSIATAITNAQNKVAAAYTAVSNKGGTLPVTQNLSNLPTAIGSIPASSTPVISPLPITPTTSQQTITAPSGTDGYSPITVSAVTSSIDANITAGNIKNGVSILGVTGTYSGGGGSSKYGATVDSFLGDVDGNNVLNAPSGNISMDFTGVKELGNYSLYGLFYYRDTVTSVSFPDLETIGSNAMYQFSGKAGGGKSKLSSFYTPKLKTIGASGLYRACYYSAISGAVDLSKVTSCGANGLYGTFDTCDSITSVDLSSLTTLQGASGLSSCFQNASSLQSFDLSSLVNITGNNAMSQTFFGCNNLTSISFPELVSVTGSSAMSMCFYVTNSYGGLVSSISFPKLSTISGSRAFASCFYARNTLQSLSFPALTSTSFGSNTNQFNGMLQRVTGCTVHFPSNLQSVIGSWSDVTAGFGGTNTTVLFDLTATT